MVTQVAWSSWCSITSFPGKKRTQRTIKTTTLQIKGTFWHSPPERFVKVMAGRSLTLGCSTQCVTLIALVTHTDFPPDALPPDILWAVTKYCWLKLVTIPSSDFSLLFHLLGHLFISGNYWTLRYHLTNLLPKRERIQPLSRTLKGRVDCLAKINILWKLDPT